MTSRSYRQSFPAARLSLERDTENVPDDGRFHLIVAGEIVGSFRSEKAAQKEYSKHRQAYLDEHPVEHTKLEIDQVVRQDQDRLSNKQLIWGPEDFERVERMTKRR